MMQREQDDREETRVLVGRVGSFVLALPHDRAEDVTHVEEFLHRLRKKLLADSRVTKVEAPESLREYFTRDFIMYASLHDVDAASVLTGRHLHAVELSDVIWLTVTVPIKNQPEAVGGGEPRAESYSVGWDGLTLVVAWEQPDRGRAIAGGQVLEDILKTAVSDAGGSLYVQACTPLCEHRFLHADVMSVDVTEEGEAGVFATVADGDLVEITVSAELDAEQFVRALMLDLSGPMAMWSRAKNLGQHALELEIVARRELDELLNLHQQEARALAARIFSRVWFRGMRMRYSRRSEAIVSRLWVAMAKLEESMRERSRHWQTLRRRAEERHVEGVVLNEIAEDDQEIASLDLSLLRSATEHAANRLHSRAAVTASVWGAGGGVVAAAIVTVLLS